MRFRLPSRILFAAMLVIAAGRVRAQDLKGVVKAVDSGGKFMVVSVGSGEKKDVLVNLGPPTTKVESDGKSGEISDLKPGTKVVVKSGLIAEKVTIHPAPPHRTIGQEFLHNFSHNLFKPLLLFFYMGFLIPILRVEFEFPYAIYQGLTMYLLISIGWRGGEELSALNPSVLRGALGFMGVGVVLNFLIGILAYLALSLFTNLRRVDKATVAGYYGSDSAGTFVTCLGVLATVGLAYDAYMPVMLAVMEIPGCLVALYLVSRLRAAGMDPLGNMPDEPGHDPNARPDLALADGRAGLAHAADSAKRLSMEEGSPEDSRPVRTRAFLNAKLLHEVFLNPGLYLLFAGIVVGYVSGSQGPDVTRDDDNLFNSLFQGLLCLFLLEMGMTASRKLRDLATAGWGYVLFGLVAPNVFATMGIVAAHLYGSVSGIRFEPGTYVLFSVLCGASSYIAVPAVQRLAIPEASPTLPLAASLGLTFSYNVTVGIPIYIEISKAVGKMFHTL